MVRVQPGEPQIACKWDQNAVGDRIARAEWIMVVGTAPMVVLAAVDLATGVVFDYWPLDVALLLCGLVAASWLVSVRRMASRLRSDRPVSASWSWQDWVFAAVRVAGWATRSAARLGQGSSSAFSRSRRRTELAWACCGAGGFAVSSRDARRATAPSEAVLGPPSNSLAAELQAEQQALRFDGFPARNGAPAVALGDAGAPVALPDRRQPASGTLTGLHRPTTPAASAQTRGAPLPARRRSKPARRGLRPHT